MRIPGVFPPIPCDSSLPPALDFRDSTFFNSAIHNQYTCGDCYAYASVAVAEYVVSKALGITNSLDLSESSIAFCGMNCYPGGIGGCNGIDWGNRHLPLAMMCENGVLPEGAFPEETIYTYCNPSFWINSPRYVCNNYVQLPANDHIAIQHALIEHGPLYTALDIWRSDDWHAYFSYPIGRTIWVDATIQDFQNFNTLLLLLVGDAMKARVYIG
jgi:hypothetical protein